VERRDVIAPGRTTKGDKKKRGRGGEFEKFEGRRGAGKEGRKKKMAFSKDPPEKREKRILPRGAI